MHRLCHELPLEYLSEESVSDFLNVKFQSNVFPSGLAKVLHNKRKAIRSSWLILLIIWST
jgi:hypothetical protein